MIVPCECGAKLKIDEAKIGPTGVKIRCPRCGNILPVRKDMVPGTRQAAPPMPYRTSKPVVLVAHDSEVMRDTISGVLLDAGFQIDTAADGVEALRKATLNKPQGLVLDVGLPGMYGFELCERLKGNRETSDIKIILVSSVYDMKRYKRTPISLYGADDYIEKHHVSDYLPLKLRKLIFPDEFPSPPVGQEKTAKKNELPETARPPAREFAPSLLAERQPNAEEPLFRSPRAAVIPHPPGLSGIQDTAAMLPESFSLDSSIFQKEECDIPGVDAADPEAVEKARRFARIIVSDIALYNQEAVAEGLKNGTFYELLKTDVDEGRELYERRVPKVIRDRKDYYQEAFDSFISAQMKNVR